MRLHYVQGSPYARMVRIAWRERGIAGITEQETTLRDPESDLLPHNPVGRVPTLVLADGTALSETLLILTHLDRLHTGPRLIPETPAGLAELGQAIGLLDGGAVWNRAGLLRAPPHRLGLAPRPPRAGRLVRCRHRHPVVPGHHAPHLRPLITLDATAPAAIICDRTMDEVPMPGPNAGDTPEASAAGARQ